MAVIHQDIKVWSNDAKPITVALDGYESLSGVRYRWGVSRTAISEPLVTKYSTDGDITINNFKATISTTRHDTKDLRGIYKHQLQAIDGNNDPVTLTEGMLRVYPSMFDNI